MIEYRKNYSKTSGSLWQYYRDEPALRNTDDIAIFSAADNSASLKFKQKTVETDARDTKNIEIIVQLKYLSRLFENPWNAFN